jgi:LPS sulfotransferase NodH
MKIELSDADFDIVMRALMQQPWAVVAQLIPNLSQQMQAQRPPMPGNVVPLKQGASDGPAPQ